MKQEESKILKGMGKETGFKVPENYFADFNKRMLESLPEVEIVPQDKQEKQEKKNIISKPSMWVRVRPFVYMAASVVGIFCMITVFNNLNGTKDVSDLAKEAKQEQTVVTDNAADKGNIVTYEDSVTGGLTNETMQEVAK